MNVALITNLNGIGLELDARLVSDYLNELGHTTTMFQYDASPAEYGVNINYDLSIFFEVAPRELLDLSTRRWLFSNPEWMTPDKIQTVQRNFEKIFAKTHYAKRILDPHFPGKVHYVGFLARDQYDPTIKREPWFLHIGGNSAIRGTQAVIDAWQWKKDGKAIDAKLCIVSNVQKEWPKLPNLFYWNRLSEADLKTLQNQCMFHIYPSQTEGFGHAIHEAQSVGARIFVTDAPPMNELLGVYELPAIKSGKFNLADLYEVSALDIYKAVTTDLRWHEEIRQEFLINNEAFEVAFKKHLDAPTGSSALRRIRKEGDPKRIAFLGNFEPQESTENQILWALEQRLGYVVERLQENRVSIRMLEEASDWNDIFIWVHTRNYLKVSDNDMLGLIEKMRKRNVTSYSLHLDKFLGIPERERLVGVHPFWKTSQVWTADGSNPEWFKNRGVNHFWMKPAVSEVFCHPGTPREQYNCDVMFCGARGYHREYPFREQMVEFLEKEYGERFKHVQGVRGHELNDAYASAKVIVGDCIFAGTPFYWSDRLPETCGRHGFLLHPTVEGLGWHPVFTYVGQNLDSLRDLIESSLDNPHRRKVSVEMCSEYVIKNDTWSVRLGEILCGS